MGTRTLIDSILVTFPVGYKLENVPKDVSFAHSFGEFYHKILPNGSNQLWYYRKIILNGGEYGEELYNEWVSFVKSIHRADRQRIVLKKVL